MVAHRLGGDARWDVEVFGVLAGKRRREKAKIESFEASSTDGATLVVVVVIVVVVVVVVVVAEDDSRSGVCECCNTLLLT